MKILLRAVITGFGLSLGSALYKKVSQELGLGDGKDDDKDKDADRSANPVSHVPNDRDGDGDIDPT